MSKRAFDEIPDEEWDSEAFNPSIIFKRDPPPPPLESFAYRSSNVRRQPPEPSHVINLEDDIDEEDQIFAPAPAAARGKRFVVNEDSDEEEVREVVKVENVGSRKDKAQSKVFKLSDDELDELIEAVGDEDDIYEEDEVEEEELMVNESEPDLVGEALRKCAQISSELRRELYGSSARSCDRYAEVESSSVRIVTQDDVSEACANEEAGFEPILKPYQLVGVNFLLLLHRKNIGGAILADEMGLGKTVQAVTYLNLLKHLYNDPGPHLIVSPASLLENWQRELERWCPSFSVILFHGSGRTIFSKELSSLGKAGKPPSFNVLLACYSLFERRSEQQKDGRKVLKYWPWSCVLLDEAHALKDKGSYRWKCLMAVAKTARQRLLLTGTPLQNSLHELWSLLEFMMPKIFATENVDLKKLLNSHDDSLISRIKSILGPFILRRLKTDVMQQLVQKVQRVDYVTMEAEQFQVYQDAINEYRSVSQARIVKLQGDNKDKPITISKSQISNYFMQFRKIANHPLLVRHIYKDNDILRYAKVLYAKGAFGFECNVERVIQELHTYNDFEIHRLLLSYLGAGVGTLDDQHVLGSAKCQALAKLLPSLQKSGSRVLIFSQWTSMLDILEWTLDVIGLTYKRLDGSTQVLERQNIVDTFNNDPTIFACLLSTRAGGQGLNLIGANTVIIHDMDFNPQIDRQAEDRCHRIGQTKPVTVYRLVTKGTVDENIYEIAKRKLLLDAAVLQNGPEQDNDIDMPEKTMGEILSSLLLV